MKKTKTKLFARKSFGEKVFYFLNYTILIFFTIIILVPLWTVLMNSFVSEIEIAQRGVFIMIPRKFDPTAYSLLLGKNSSIFNAYKNTIFLVTVGTICNLLFTTTLAYGLSKRGLKGRTLFIGLIFFSMLFNGGLVPAYLLVKSLGLLDSLWALIIPYLVNTWNMFIMRNFFYAIPKSLEEAAYIDGANPVQTLILIVLPLSMPAIATIGLFYAVGLWNQWFQAVLYITDSTKLPMQNILRNIVASSSAGSLQDIDSSLYEELEKVPPAQAVKAATIVVGTVPILLVYPFVQKYFVKGVMIGSIKG